MIRVIALVITIIILFLAGLGGAVWWKVQSDLYDHGVMDGD
jgi:hypothetical protein